MTREEVIAAARQRLGAPFVHQGRSMFGFDCIGLIVDVLKEKKALAIDYDVNGYDRMPDGTLFKECDRLLIRIPSIRLACLAVMKFAEEPQHIGFIGEHKGRWTLIHSLSPHGVIEHRLTHPWPGRIVGCFDIPGIQ